MPRAIPLSLLAALSLSLCGCGPGENAPAPGGVTVGEARALDDAAAMLDQQRSPIDSASAAPAEARTPSATPTP
jgi:hypothetical protein